MKLVTFSLTLSLPFLLRARCATNGEAIRPGLPSVGLEENFSLAHPWSGSGEATVLHIPSSPGLVVRWPPGDHGFRAPPGQGSMFRRWFSVEFRENTRPPSTPGAYVRVRTQVRLYFQSILVRTEGKTGVTRTSTFFLLLPPCLSAMYRSFSPHLSHRWSHFCELTARYWNLIFERSSRCCTCSISRCSCEPDLWQL